MLACSTHGRALYHQIEYRAGDALVFGSETQGLGAEFLARFAPEHVVRIPMVAQSRSLNLSNAVSVVLYEAWRQNGFAGAVDTGTRTRA
jgi:tRNA (cytidine/uridine-2'-O-)-methyltransferase